MLLAFGAFSSLGCAVVERVSSLTVAVRSLDVVEESSSFDAIDTLERGVTSSILAVSGAGLGWSSTAFAVGVDVLSILEPLLGTTSSTFVVSDLLDLGTYSSILAVVVVRVVFLEPLVDED